MVYIMVTNWVNHWDKLKGGRAYFTKGIILQGSMKDKQPVDDTQTLFIKIGKETGEFEKAWIGKVRNFQNRVYSGKECVEFDVILENPLSELPSKYISYKIGWHLEDQLALLPPEKNVFYPGFFDILKQTENWSDFERYSFCLLKILGLHEIYKFPREHQAGKADGFFIFKNLSVLFDFTLEENFEKTKDTQIDNYCSQLRGGILKHNFREFNVSQHAKQVWIITKKINSRLIKVQSAVAVKEVGVGKLMEIYRKRLEENLNEEALEKLLQEL